MSSRYVIYYENVEVLLLWTEWRRAPYYIHQSPIILLLMVILSQPFTYARLSFIAERGSSRSWVSGVCFGHNCPMYDSELRSSVFIVAIAQSPHSANSRSLTSSLVADYLRRGLFWMSVSGINCFHCRELPGPLTTASTLTVHISLIGT